MADEGDYSSQFELEHNTLIIAAHNNRHRIKPEFNTDGEKICIDCGDTIPPERAKLSFVVRCVYCQQLEER